jgi:hypothetical protein
VDSKELIGLFENNGFTVTAIYHWYGLAVMTDKIFGDNKFSRGWAPLVSLKGIKQ